MKPSLMVWTLLAASSLAHAAEWHKHWNISGKPEVHISAGDASVILEPGAGNSIDAIVTTRGWSIGDTGIRVSDHQNGDRIELDIKLPEMHFNLGSHSIEVVVQVPRDLLADIHTSDGSIRMRDLAGTIRADSSDGSIDADHLDGSLEAHASDGSVTVSGRFDNLTIHTSDGSITAEIFKGSRVNTDWRVQTGDGSVALRLPKDLNANLEIRTGDGHINLGIPLTVTGFQNEHGIQGKLGAGGASVLVRTSDGSISVGAS